nr:hypothetical protein [Candidatus Schneideria nysicola]
MGKFIVIEGLEGAGKSTAIQQIKKILKNHHIDDIIVTRDPGGTPFADALRNLLIEKKKRKPFLIIPNYYFFMPHAYNL